MLDALMPWATEQAKIAHAEYIAKRERDWRDTQIGDVEYRTVGLNAHDNPAVWADVLLGRIPVESLGRDA